MDIASLQPAYGAGGWFESRRNLFRSEPSARWFLRTHKPELINKGAVVIVAKRIMVQPKTMDRVCGEIFKRQAQATAQVAA